MAGQHERPPNYLDRALRDLLGKMTANRQERRNIFWRTVSMVLTGGAAAAYGGELWAGFLTRTGFSNTQIGFLTSVNTFSTASGLLILMGMADRISARVRVYTICLLAAALPPILTIGIALAPRAVLPLST